MKGFSGMALDTQPLSVGRRVMMVGALLGFLGVSLGFAEWLVVRRETKPFVTVDLEGVGFTGRVEEVSADEMEGRTGMVEGHERRVDVFTFEVQVTGSGNDVGAAAEGAKEIFGDVMGEAPTELKTGEIGGRPGVEASGVTGAGRSGWVRFAIVEGHGVAICYSGVGRFTDADRKLFEEICGPRAHFVGAAARG